MTDTPTYTSYGNLFIQQYERVFSDLPLAIDDPRILQVRELFESGNRSDNATHLIRTDLSGAGSGQRQCEGGHIHKGGVMKWGDVAFLRGCASKVQRVGDFVMNDKRGMNNANGVANLVWWGGFENGLYV